MNNSQNKLDEADDLLVIIREAIEGYSSTIGRESTTALCNSIERVRALVNTDINPA